MSQPPVPQPPATPPTWPQPVYERRRRRRRTLDPVSITVFAITAALVLLLQLFTVGALAFTVAAVVALVPLPIYLACVLLIDRFHPEPTASLAWTFLAGGSVVIFIAYVINTSMDLIYSEAFGASTGSFLSAATTAPVVEESAKAAVLVFLLWRERHRFNGILDGVVYASMVGLGFATIENIQYYGLGILDGTIGITAAVRGVFSPFAHPFFTAMTGIGLAIAANTTGAKRWLAPILGLVMAITLHAIWNGSTGVAEGFGFIAAFLFLMVPAFTVLVVVAIVDMRREKRVVRQHLEFERRQGLLSVFDVDALCSVTQRRRMIAAARRLHPEAGRIAHELATKSMELAFTRERIVKGTFSPRYGDPRRRVQALGQQVAELRRRLPPPPPHAPWTGLVGALGTAPEYAFQRPLH